VADRSLTELIRIYFKAYETKNRSALESTLSNDLLSPVRTMITSIVPPVALLAQQQAHQDDPHTQAFRSRQRSLCPLRFGAEQPFRNTEFFTGSGGKVKTIEVYFGSKIGGIEDIK